MKKEARDQSERMYCTPEQKTALVTFCEKKGVPISAFIRQLLVEKGIFDDENE